MDAKPNGASPLLRRAREALARWARRTLSPPRRRAWRTRASVVPGLAGAVCAGVVGYAAASNEALQLAGILWLLALAMALSGVRSSQQCVSLAGKGLLARHGSVRQGLALAPWGEIVEVRTVGGRAMRMAGIASLRVICRKKGGGRWRLPDLGPYDRAAEVRSRIETAVREGPASAGWPAPLRPADFPAPRGAKPPRGAEAGGNAAAGEEAL